MTTSQPVFGRLAGIAGVRPERPFHDARPWSREDSSPSDRKVERQRSDFNDDNDMRKDRHVVRLWFREEGRSSFDG